MSGELLWATRDWSNAEAKDKLVALQSSKKTSTEGDTFLVWGDEGFDSKHFGLRMGRLIGGWGEMEDIRRLIPRFLQEVDEQGYDHFVVSLPSENPALIRLFERNGFFMTDTHCRLILEDLDIDMDYGDLEIGLIREDEIPQAQEMSKTIFNLSRYAWDPMLSEEGRSSLMMEWVKNDCTTRGDLVLAARLNGEFIGYTAALFDKERDTLVYDLLAVGPKARGKGAGGALFIEGIKMCRDWAKYVQLDTQGANRSAHRLYKRLGFVIDATNICLHRHRHGVIPE